MNYRKWHWSMNSLRIKLAASALIMTLPLVGMLIYNNFYSIQVVRDQVADSYFNTLTLYMNQIDGGLNDVDSYMNAIAFGNDLFSVSQALTEVEYYTAKFYLFNKLSNDISLYRSLNSFFVYEDQRKDFMSVSSKGNMSYEDNEELKNFIINMIHQKGIMKENAKNRWQYHQIGQAYYLIDIVQRGEAYLGGWVRMDQLVAPLQSLMRGKQGEILFANDQGEPITDTTIVQDNGIQLHENLPTYYLSGSNHHYLVVASHSGKGNFSLVALIPDAKILDNLPYLQRLIWLISIGSMIFIPVGLYYMRKAFLNPLNRVLYAMKKVRGGDWSNRVEMDKVSNEFYLLGDSFNAMMNEVQTLRVNVFEEQLNKQREELQRLQLQVNPHFFLNSLNIVYNLAKVKNFNLILEMTESLIHYFRFLFRSTTSFVKLRDELEHTRNYLNIQSLRFPGQLTWTVDVPDYLTDVPVPPLIIQSFVENSIKHAFTMDEGPIDIAVQIRFFDKESGSRMKISIRDTGCGFNDRVLDELQAGRSIQNEQGEHTGIWNVHRRLRLLYDDTVLLYFYNDEENGGAVVEMILPTNLKMEEIS